MVDLYNPKSRGIVLYIVYFNVRNFRGFWANSRKFIPAKFIF